MDSRAWRALVHGVAQSDATERLAHASFLPSTFGDNPSGTAVRSFWFFYFGTLDSSTEGLVRINPRGGAGNPAHQDPAGGPVVKPHQASSFPFDLGYLKGPVRLECDLSIEQGVLNPALPAGACPFPSEVPS